MTQQVLIIPVLISWLDVGLMSLFTTTGTMPLLVEIYFPEGIISPEVSTLCADMNYH